jgi:hypothetical protein
MPKGRPSSGQQWMMQCVIEIQVSSHLVVDDYGGKIGSIKEIEHLFDLVTWKG